MESLHDSGLGKHPSSHAEETANPQITKVLSLIRATISVCHCTLQSLLNGKTTTVVGGLEDLSEHLEMLCSAKVHLSVKDDCIIYKEIDGCLEIILCERAALGVGEEQRIVICGSICRIVEAVCKLGLLLEMQDGPVETFENPNNDSTSNLSVFDDEHLDFQILEFLNTNQQPSSPFSDLPSAHFKKQKPLIGRVKSIVRRKVKQSAVSLHQMVRSLTSRGLINDGSSIATTGSSCGCSKEGEEGCFGNDELGMETRRLSQISLANPQGSLDCKSLNEEGVAIVLNEECGHLTIRGMTLARMIEKMTLTERDICKKP